MKHILFIATGGTIASLDTGAGLTPQLKSEDLMSLVPELKDLCACDAVQLMNLDSTNISSEQWLEMARCVRRNYDRYDGFVITHGTDTMAYTAAALSYLIQNIPKPVVITGAQKSYHAFDSVDYPPTAIFRGRRLVWYIREEITGEPVFYDAMDPGVFVLKLVPGTSAGIFQALRKHCRALVIESFGVGGLPQYGDTDFYAAVRDWVQSGRMLVMTTQVPFEGSDMEVYQVGQRVKKELGLIEAYGMTTEAVVTKLMWILARSGDPLERRRLFETPVWKDQIF